MIEPKKAVQKMKPYNPPLEGRRGLLRLDFNENTIGPSKKVISAIKNATAEEISAYPEYDEFKKKLSKYVGVRQNEVVLTNATDEAIKLVVDTYMEQGDEIIVPVPTFPMFRFYAEAAGAKVTEVMYNKDLSFPTDKILRRISKRTKIVVLVNPNSPTGTEIPREDIIKIIKKAKDCIVLLDEAYSQFFKKSYKNFVNVYKNLMVIQTFSKAFGIGGLRLGYIITDERNAKNLMKAGSPYSVNSIAVAAGLAALDSRKYVENYVKDIEEAKKYTLDTFTHLHIDYYESKANFVLVKFGSKNKDIVEFMKKNKILIRDQSDKPLLEGCSRVTIGTKRQMKKFFEVLDKYYESLNI